MYKNLIFNNRKSYKDFRLFVTNFTLIPPKPRVLKETIPYKDGSFDFSFIHGKRLYDERLIEVTLSYDAFDEQEVYKVYSDAISWLYSGTEGEIKLDDVTGYFKGSVSEITTFERFMNLGELTVVFACYPFKFDDAMYGEDIWDTFNFETDMIEQNEFKVNGSTEVNIIINGIEIVPSVNCTSNMSVRLNNKTYSFTSGNNKNSNFTLKNGDNNMTITGNGTIKFIFRKESF